MTDAISLSLEAVHELALRVLTRHGRSGARAQAIARVMLPMTLLGGLNNRHG